MTLTSGLRENKEKAGQNSTSTDTGKAESGEGSKTAGTGTSDENWVSF